MFRFPKTVVAPVLLASALWTLPIASFAQETCDSFALRLTTTPTMEETPSNLRHAHELIENMPDQADIVLLGDSIFQGMGRTAQELFPNNSVWNFSVGGDKVQHVQWRLDQLPENDLAPDTVIIFIGTNNLGVRANESCATFAGIREIVTRVQALWAPSHVFVVEIPPRGADFLQFDDLRRDLNAQIAAGAAEIGYTNVPIDEHSFTCGNYGREPLPRNTRACFPDQVYTCENYRSDNLHFEKPGYFALRSFLASASIAAFGEDVMK